MDGIELQLGHGTLLQQFLSPTSNSRTDEFGGNDAGRLLFPRKVLERVREEAGEGLAVGIRVSADEFIPNGLRPDTVIAIVAEVESAGLVDFVNVSHSSYTDIGDSLTSQVADMHYPPAPFRYLPALFKQRFPQVPIFAACGIGSIELAEKLLADGVADVAAMTRAHIADPDLVRKFREGNEALIRRCIGCNQACLGNLERGVAISCTVNPAVGYEGLGEDPYKQLLGVLASDALMQLEAPRQGKVLVVGAGPAGLEAAIGLRQAGYGVAVAERACEAGGLLKVVSSLAGRERWRHLYEDQVRIARLIGVGFTYGVDVDVEYTLLQAPDIVVIATGSRETATELPEVGTGIGIEEVLSLGEAELRESGTLLVDAHGGWPAPSLAEELACRGARVAIISEQDQFAPGIPLYSKYGLLTRLADHGVPVHLMRRVSARRGHALVISDVLTGRAEVLDGFERVVVCAPRTARDELAAGLVSAGFGGHVQVIGDAYAPRTATQAVADGRSVVSEAIALMSPQ